MSAVGNSESATSIVRPDPTYLDPNSRSSHPSHSPFDHRPDGSGTDRKSSGGDAGGIGGLLRTLLGLLLVAGVIGGGAWAAGKDAPFGTTKTGPVALTHKVERGDLVVTITDDGNVESASNIDIRCLVAGGGTIKEIVTDGTIVKQGDKLVEIDSALIDEQILTQKISYEKARALRDQAKNDLEAAKITLREYVEGTYIKDRQAVDSQITIAEENERSARNTLLYTERMFRKGYVTPLQLESQQFAVKRAGIDLETAKTAKRVLEEFTFAKMKNDLETLVATAGAKATSEEAAYELEESKLRRLETQKQNCIIIAPQAGMVVYANEGGGGRNSSDRPKIEEGAVVRESQVILRVPDLTQMQVKATVHESKVESLRPDMRASIRIQNRKLTGHVTAVANQPEPGSWMSSNIKEYAAYVRIDGVQNDLKPGMTAEVEILVAEKKDVLTVPVQCVVEQGGKFYCWKVDGTESLKTEVKLGAGDDRKVEVISGLSEGDVVLQNPPEKSGGDFSRSAEAKNFGDGPRGTGKSGSDAGPNGTGPRSAGGESPVAAGGARGPAGGQRMDIMANDKNGDGKVSLDEAPEPMKNFFGRMDTDGDGFITAVEAAAARARRQAQGGGVGGNQ